MVPATFGTPGSQVVVHVAGIGLLRAEADGLVFEVRPQHESEVSAIHVPLADVSEVELKSSWVRTRLILRPRRLAAFEGLLAAGTLSLSVARRDRDLASSWATALSFALLDREGGSGAR